MGWHAASKQQPFVKSTFHWWQAWHHYRCLRRILTDEAAAKIDEKFGGKIKTFFATKCTWCYQGYGMKQADGGFKSQLKDEEVQALAEYIKALPTNWPM